MRIYNTKKFIFRLFQTLSILSLPTLPVIMAYYKLFNTNDGIDRFANFLCGVLFLGLLTILGFGVCILFELAYENELFSRWLNWLCVEDEADEFIDNI